MVCPRCQTANPEGAAFCFQCGQALKIICANCGTPNPQAARFCFNCGKTLVQVAPEPPPAETSASEGERRVVTVMFCDVTGSTAYAEQLDPEEWAEIMNQA